MTRMDEFIAKWNASRERLRSKLENSSGLTGSGPQQAEPEKNEPARQQKQKKRQVMPEC